jgi:hypothetical protein
MKTPKNQAPAAAGLKRPAPGRLDRETQGKIGEQLRRMHDDIVREGVPDRFADLIARLGSATDPTKT